MIVPSGYIVAMDDGYIIWNPRCGQKQKTKINALATALLGLFDPDGDIKTVVVGDNSGRVNLIDIGTMETICSFTTSSPIRSICVSNLHNNSLIAGCDDGTVYLVGKDIPGGVRRILELEHPVSGVIMAGRILRISQGWETKEIEWNHTLYDNSKILVSA
jgi:WD40 repeat protein